MTKLIKYNLNEDGSIPDYIIDGGYLPIFSKSGKYDYIGSVADSFIQKGFTKQELIDYTNSEGLVNFNPDTLEVIPNENIVEILWQKLSS